MPGARWNPIPGNHGRDGKPKIGVVVHHMDGSFASAEAHFMNPDSQASSHFGITYAGEITQWVDTADVAYTQCMGNWQGWVGIENESDPGAPDAPPTPEQVAAMGRIIAWLGTPATPATSMTSGGVGYHRQFGGPCEVAWGQTACPGDGFVNAIPAICAAAGAHAPVPDPLPPLEDFMYSLVTAVGSPAWWKVWLDNGQAVKRPIGDLNPVITDNAMGLVKAKTVNGFGVPSPFVIGLAALNALPSK